MPATSASPLASDRAAARLLILIGLVAIAGLATAAAPPARAVAQDPKPVPEGPAPEEPKTPQPAPDQPEPKEPEPTPVVRGKVSFLPLVHGFRRSAETYRPLLVIHPGPETEGKDDGWASIEKRFLESNSKRLAKFICAEIDQPGSTEVIERFGGVSTTLIALCDFRGVVLKRWDEKLPSRGGFRKALNTAWKLNGDLAIRFQNANQAIEKARYALKTEKYREACRLYLTLEELKLPTDCEPAKAAAKLRSEMDEIIQKRRKKVDEKEKKKDYLGAIDDLELLMSDFPLPDVKDSSRKKITELYRKLHGYGG